VKENLPKATGGTDWKTILRLKARNSWGGGAAWSYGRTRKEMTRGFVKGNGGCGGIKRKKNKGH